VQDRIVCLSEMHDINFKTTSNGKLDYCLHRATNRIIIAIPYTANKSFTLIVQKIRLTHEGCTAEIVRVKDKIVGMTLFPSNINFFDEIECHNCDNVIQMLWDTISSNEHIAKVPTISELSVLN
jgi:hypothetical protein